jgi:hypothetical protein
MRLLGITDHGAAPLPNGFESNLSQAYSTVPWRWCTSRNSRSSTERSKFVSHDRLVRSTWDSLRSCSKHLLEAVNLLTGPRFEQRPVHREVFVRDHIGGTRDDTLEEAVGDRVLQQPIAVLGEDRWHSNRLVHLQPHEPAK